MDSMLKSLVDLILGQGLSGAFILILLYAVNYLYRSLEKLHNQRVEELRTMLQIVERNTSVMQRSTDILHRMVEVIKGCPKSD